VFEGRLVDKQSAQARVAVDGLDEPLRCRVAANAPANASGTLSVRPEGVSVKPAGDAADGVSGRVSAAMYLGNLSKLHVRLDFGKEIEALELTRRTWNVGDAVTVAFDPEQCFFIARTPPLQ